MSLVFVFPIFTALHKQPNLNGNLVVEIHKQILTLIPVFWLGKICRSDQVVKLDGIRIALSHLRHHFLKNDKAKFHLDLVAKADYLRDHFKHI